jgi:hypothetical protein
LNLKKENEGLKDNLKKGKDAYNELIKKYDDYVENSKKENLRIRNCKQMKLWREAVFQRDDYTCQMCGIRGTKLNADHIKPVCLILEEYNIKTLEEALQVRDSKLKEMVGEFYRTI